MSTFMAKPTEVERKWYVVDADGVTLGRLAAEVASILKGKKKPIYTPHVDTGDYVIVVNADKVKVTGKKLDQKVYFSHSEYVGGVKEITLRDQLKKHPERVVEHAVKGMLPKGALGKQMYMKLRVYAGHQGGWRADRRSLCYRRLLRRFLLPDLSEPHDGSCVRQNDDICPQGDQEYRGEIINISLDTKIGFDYNKPCGIPKPHDFLRPFGQSFEKGGGNER